MAGIRPDTMVRRSAGLRRLPRDQGRFSALSEFESMTDRTQNNSAILYESRSVTKHFNPSHGGSEGLNRVNSYSTTDKVE